MAPSRSPFSFLRKRVDRDVWTKKESPMSIADQNGIHDGRRLDRRSFLKRVGWGGVGATALVGASRRPSFAQGSSPYPDWIPASTKPPKRGGSIARASAWDPPVIDPRLTQSVGLFQFAGLVHNRLVRYRFTDEATGTNDLTLVGDLAESWEANSDHRVWTFKLRHGVKWQSVAPLNGRELVAADVKYCFEAYAKEGVQSFTFREIEGMETPDKYTLRIHLKTPNVLFAHNLAEPIAVIFSREVLEEDGDLKKRMIGTGPYLLKEHTRKVRIVLSRNPDYFDKSRPYLDEYTILSTPDAATRLAAFRSGQSDIIWQASPAEVETVRKTNASAQIQAYANTLAPFGVALAQDKPPILAQLGPWVQYRPAEAKKLLSEAGHPNGFETTLFYYEYFPQMTSQVQLVQQDLKRNLNINVKITKMDYTTYYGRYVESKWEGMSWGFQSGHAVGLDERTYHYLHSKSTKNFFCVNDPTIDELVSKLRQTPDRAEQRVVTKKIVDREFDQVLRMWMPYDNGFLAFQPPVRNMAAAALRRTDGYGSPAIARVWLDK